MLSTAFALLSLLAAAVAVVFAHLANRSSTAAHEAAEELGTAIRHYKAASDRLSAVEGRLDRLAGRVYSQTRRPQPTDDPAAAGSDRSYAGVNQLDPELAAELALQAAPPVAPGRK